MTATDDRWDSTWRCVSCATLVATGGLVDHLAQDHGVKAATPSEALTYYDYVMKGFE